MRRDRDPLSASTVQAAWHSFRMNTPGVNDQHRIIFVAGAAWALAKVKSEAERMAKSTRQFMDEKPKRAAQVTRKDQS